MKRDVNDWTKRFDFFFVTAWLMTSVGIALVSLIWFGMDFRGYYAAAQVLLAGGNPYDYRQVAEALKNITGEMGNNPYYYPPWFAWLFIPVAKLPFQIARAIWMAFNLILWDVSLWRAGNLMTWRAQGWQRYALFTLTTISFAWITFRYEQAGILVFAMLVAALLSLQNQKWIAAGIWLALLLVKPNITLGVVLGISLWLLRKGQWRPVATMIGALLVLLIISTAITPDWYKPFFESGFGRGLTVVMDGPEKIVGTRINTTMLDWMANMDVPSNLRSIFYGASVVIAVAVFLLLIMRSQSLLEVASLSLLIFCAVTPYALQYDYPPLVIALLWALSLPVAPRTARLNVLWVAFIFCVSVSQPSIAFRYWVVVGLIALVINTRYHLRAATDLSAAAA